MNTRTCPSCGNPIPENFEVCLSCRETGTLAFPGSPHTGYSGPAMIGGYRILRQLGRGGMGTVFEAIDVKMDRKVALKVLSFSLTDSERAGARFAREAWIAGKLSHPNLVKVFERGEVEGSAFFSMELIDGGSLFDVIQNLKIQGRDATWGLEFGNR